MNVYTIESLISFCDEFQENEIATEGVKELGKSIWEGIKRIFRKIVNWFANIIRSVNYFKNATLDSQLNSDLVEVLKIAQPKTELNFGWLNLYYKLATAIPTDNNGTHSVAGDVFGEAKVRMSWFSEPESHITTIEEQIERSVYDIDGCLKASGESEPMKRITANEYKNSNMVTIPLGQITSDLKRSHTGSTRAENELSRIDNASTKLLTFTKGKELVTKAHVFYQKLSQFYRFRIDLLSKFLNYAKASLGGTINNMKDRFGNVDKLRTNFNSSLKATFKARSKQEIDDIMETYNKARNAETYEEYLPYYKKLADTFKVKGAIENLTKISDNVLAIIYNKEGSEYPIGNQKLYHHSYETWEIKELKPFWTTPSGVLFPTPRIYFHVGAPLNRYAHGLKDDNDGTIYTPTVNINKVFVDKELSRTACYVETTKPIPVKPVDFSEWKNAKDVEVGFK